MTAPYVERTTKLIAGEPDLLTRSLLRAELACYWARVGDFERAENLRASLRTEFGDGKSPRVSIMIMCLEGLLLYFRDLDRGAKDRIDRANLLAGAVRDNRLLAFTSAWQAHIAFNREEFESMARALDVCLACATDRDLQALSRVSLVLGDLFAYLSDRTTYQSWYAVARDFALKLGDHASLGAITYNRAALHVFECRIRDLLQEVPAAELDILDAEVRSAVNYQSLAELKSLDHLLSSARVGSLILRRDFRAGLDEAKAVLAAHTVREGTAQRALLLADAAVCAEALNDSTSASLYLTECRAQPLDSFGSDDLALIYRQLDRVAVNQGYAERSAERHRAHLEERSKLSGDVQRFKPIPDVVRRASAPA